MYPVQDLLPDPEIRTFITNFYRISDSPDSNELWVSHFTTDAQVTMGNDTGRGQQGEQERTHTLLPLRHRISNDLEREQIGQRLDLGGRMCSDSRASRKDVDRRG